MGFTDNELCNCGETQTMPHIVNSCPLTKFDSGLLRLHEADEAAVNWLTTWLLAYDNNEVAAAKLRVTTLEHLKSVRAQPSRVLSAAMLGATNEEREALGCQDSVKRNLRGYVNNVFVISV